ncbi:hypothetical protein GcC1_098020 [Golovinomyces cichoracearum]|uniref:Uncharacterized protein n=1 Tax=Golovinomyces cichoracearum TaxID=62708 RepID=A0A420IAF3_9PEZI|nr:hypothetical protein GcC1_098020 [Golovinomyces cichoracearum]
MRYYIFLLLALAAFSVAAEKPDAYNTPGTAIDKDSKNGSGKNKTEPASPSIAASYPKSTGSSNSGMKPNPNPLDNPLKGTASASLMIPLSQLGGLVSIAGLGIGFLIFM